MIPGWPPSHFATRPFLLGLLVWALGIVLLVFVAVNMANTGRLASSELLFQLLIYWFLGGMAAVVLISGLLGGLKS